MTMLLRIAASAMLLVSVCTFADETALLTKAAEGAHRSETNIARNEWRHPVETLTFFGIKNDMRVAEIWPGSGGWYTEILAPYLKENGVLVTLNYDGSYRKRILHSR